MTIIRQNDQKKKIALNLSSLLLGKGLILIINFFTIALAARYLGVELFGSFSYLLAITGVISKMVDMGQSPIIFREISSDKNNDFLISTSLSIRTISLLIIMICTNLIISFIEFSNVEWMLLNLFLLNIIFSAKYLNFRELLDIPFKRSIKMFIPTFAVIIENILLLIIVIVIVENDFGFKIFGISYVGVNFPGFLVMLFLVRKKEKVKINFSLKKAKWLILQSLPLFVFVICSSLFQQLEIIILAALEGKHSVGLYSAALRLTAPLTIIPSAVVTTLFPIIVNKIGGKRSELNKLLIFSFKSLFIISFTIASLFTFKGTFIIELVFGNSFLEANNLTIILLWAQTFLFFNFFALDLFTAYNAQKNNSVYAIILLVSHLILLLVLIPSISILGASISKFISSFIGFIFIVNVLKRIKLNANFISKNILIWSITTILSFYFLSYLNEYMYFSIGFLFSFASLFFFNVFSQEEKNIFYNFLPLKRP